MKDQDRSKNVVSVNQRSAFMELAEKVVLGYDFICDQNDSDDIMIFTHDCGASLVVFKGDIYDIMHITHLLADRKRKQKAREEKQGL